MCFDQQGVSSIKVFSDEDQRSGRQLCIQPYGANTCYAKLSSTVGYHGICHASLVFSVYISVLSHA